MENEIKKLIEKYDPYDGIVNEHSRFLMDEIIKDLKSLLDFKQKNCCGNFVIEEVTHKKIELAAYNKGYDDGYDQAQFDLTGSEVKNESAKDKTE